jgi:hypothetical protein
VPQIGEYSAVTGHDRKETSREGNFSWYSYGGSQAASQIEKTRSVHEVLARNRKGERQSDRSRPKWR